MKLKVLIAFLTLSLVMWAQTPAPAPKATKAKADCACCEGMAKDHSCADCCKDGKCDMKDCKCGSMKDKKAACMGEKGCCGGDMKHDGKASAKTDAKMGPHCERGKG